MDTMFFEIKNTPEHIRRARVPDVKQTSPKECPRLTLAPFSRPPQVVFENIHVGTSSERDLEVFNPSKQAQQICLGRALPPGLIIDVPGGRLEVEPETCYVLTMTWTPMQPMALRKTIRFTIGDRGRYDINVVLKTVALFRGNKARVAAAKDKRVAEFRRRWREGAFESTQETIVQRRGAVMKALKCLKYDVDIMIRVFMSLDIITRIFPKVFEENPRYIARQVSSYMLVMNRSINSVELLKVASAVLTNLARYKSTGPSIYERERITPILKYMSRFCTTEPRLFCMMSTYIWVFSKYGAIKEDMTEFLKLPDNGVILLSIKQNIERKIRMDNNYEKTRSIMPQTSRCCHKRQNSFMSNTSSIKSYNRRNSLILPDLEPDFGIKRRGQPRYFEDAFQAITCLFNTYSL